MTFRVRIDPVALRQIDEFAAYLRNYDEDFAVSLLPPCHQRPTELPVAEGRKQKPLSRSRSLHQIEAPSCWHASIPSACPHRGVRSKGPYSARIVAAATPDPSLSPRFPSSPLMQAKARATTVLVDKTLLPRHRQLSLQLIGRLACAPSRVDCATARPFSGALALYRQRRTRRFIGSSISLG